MADKKISTDTPAAPDVVRLDTGDSASDWMELLREIGTEEGPLTPKIVAPPADKTSESGVIEIKISDPELEKREAARARYQQLCKAPSIKMEQADMAVLSQFSDIIAKVNAAGKALSKLKKAYPDRLPAHIMQSCRENMKETSMVMLKEFHAMRHGRQQKKYDKRYVCNSCHHIFMVPLPGDGLCDQCRASLTPRNAPY